MLVEKIKNNLEKQWCQPKKVGKTILLKKYEENVNYFCMSGNYDQLFVGPLQVILSNFAAKKAKVFPGHIAADLKE